MSNSFIHTYPPKRQSNSFSERNAGSTQSMNLSNVGVSAGASFAGNSTTNVTPSATPGYLSQPIRVTPNTVESLMYALAHTVEFQRTLNSPVTPADVKCDSLGGIVYSACTHHHDSMIRQLPAAVQKAKSLAFNLGSGDSAGGLFCMRIKVIKSVDKKSGFGSWFSGKDKTTIEEWEFVILKQQHDTLLRAGGRGQSPSVSPPPATGSSLPSVDDTTPGSSANTQNRFSEDPLHFCNDPRQVRDALMFIVMKSFEAIDGCVARDFSTADELLFEVTVEERTAV